MTTDGGETWRSGTVPGAETLQFRDVERISRNEAYLLSIGEGTDSRIYHTTDGGAATRRGCSPRPTAATRGRRTTRRS